MSNESLAAAVVLLAGLAASRGDAHEAEPSRYNYRDDVRPIFVEHCGNCHRPGGVAPMSLLEFQEAVPWANAIKMQLLQQTMPPWLPDEAVGAFRHRRSLSAEEIDIVVDWAVGQTPEGEPLTASELASTSPSPELESESEPELLLEPETAVVLTEEEFEKIACVVFPLGLDGARVATRFSVHPERATIVRRATIYRGASCDEGRPLATWLPDQRTVSFPEGSGVALSPADSLAVELSYVKGWEDDGRRLEDRTGLGLGFDDGAEPIELVPIAASGHELEAERQLLALYAEPSQGAEEEPLRVEAVLPGGESRALLVIERYDPAWREKYVLERPLTLPAGTELRLSRAGVWADFVSGTSATAEDR